MKNFKLLLATTAILSTGALAVMARSGGVYNEDTVDITVEFVNGASVTKVQDMDFGKVAIGRNETGTLILSPTGDATRTGDMEYYGHAKNAMVDFGSTGGEQLSFPDSVEVKNGDTVCGTVSDFNVADVTYTGYSCPSGQRCPAKGVGATLSVTTGDDLLRGKVCTATITVSAVTIE